MQQAIARRALVVEDHGPSRDALRRLLRTLGYEVDGVATVAEGNARLDSTRFLFLDLRLSDGDGIGLLRRIREEALPVRVAVITGSADEQMLADVHKLRPDALFIKPIDFGELVKWLEEA